MKFKKKSAGRHFRRRKFPLFVLFSLMPLAGSAQLLGLCSFDAYSGSYQGSYRLEEPLDGMCGEILHALFLFEPEHEAQCSLSKEALIHQMNRELACLKAQPEIEQTCVLSMFINCNGEVIGVRSGLEDVHRELSQEIQAFLLNRGTWTPGFYQGEPVDSAALIQITIKNGRVYLNEDE